MSPEIAVTALQLLVALLGGGFSAVLIAWIQARANRHKAKAEADLTVQQGKNLRVEARKLEVEVGGDAIELYRNLLSDLQTRWQTYQESYAATIAHLKAEHARHTEELMATINELRTERVDLLRRVSDVETEAAALREMCDEIKAEAAAVLAASRVEIDAVRTELAAEKRRSAALQSELDAALSALNLARARVSELERLVAEMRQRLETLERRGTGALPDPDQ